MKCIFMKEEPFYKILHRESQDYRKIRLVKFHLALLHCVWLYGQWRAWKSCLSGYLMTYKEAFKGNEFPTSSYVSPGAWQSSAADGAQWATAMASARSSGSAPPWPAGKAEGLSGAICVKERGQHTQWQCRHIPSQPWKKSRKFTRCSPPRLQTQPSVSIL